MIIANTNPGGYAGLGVRKLLVTMRQALVVLLRLVSFRPDVMHVNTVAAFPKIYLDFAYMHLGLWTGAKIVMHLHGSGLGVYGNTEEQQARSGRQLRHADAVLALSKPAIAELRSRGVRQARQVRNLISVRDLPRTRAWEEGGAVRLLYVGWIMKEKGILELLEAVGSVPNVELDLVGRYMDVRVSPGTSAARVQALLTRYRLHDRVRIVGEVSLDAVWEYYANSDIFVMPSHSEGLPNVLLEAMMAGLPCVVTSVGAVPEVVIENETALVVPPQEVEPLRAAIEKLASSKELREAMGRRGRERAIQEFGEENVIAQFCRIYEELLGIESGEDLQIRTPDRITPPGPRRPCGRR